MRELISCEIEEVNGGARSVVALGLGFLGNYLYDAVGGYEGINSFFSGVNDYLTDLTYRHGAIIIADPWHHSYID